MRTSAVIAVLVVVIGVCPFTQQRVRAASTDRGAWFFDVPHGVGSGQVVGTSDAREDQVITVFQHYNIARNFQSFANPVPPPVAADIAAWHVKLNAAGVTPMLLLSDAAATADLNFFTQQLINFNSGRPANEQYVGVKLDLEPQATTAWTSGTNTDRRDMLLTLRDTYAAIRAHLDANGEAGTPIYADIPVWFDVTGATIGWGNGTALTPEQERDQWFSDIANSLDGLTLMAFGTSNFAVIQANVAWELANFGDDVRIALEASVGGGGTFTDFSHFWDLVNQVEDFYAIPANNPSGHSIGLDIQDFAQLFDAGAPEPKTALLGMMGLAVLITRLHRRQGGVDGTEAPI